MHFRAEQRERIDDGTDANGGGMEPTTKRNRMLCSVLTNLITINFVLS